MEWKWNKKDVQKTVAIKIERPEKGLRTCKYLKAIGRAEEVNVSKGFIDILFYYTDLHMQVMHMSQNTEFKFDFSARFPRIGVTLSVTNREKFVIPITKFITDKRIQAVKYDS